MSKETLDLMLGLNRQELEIQIALQCAPLLTGRKISNLLTVDKRFRSAVLRLFRSSAVSCYVLYESDDRITLDIRRKMSLVLLKTGDKIRCISDTGRYIPIWKNAGRYLPDTIRQGKK